MAEFGWAYLSGTTTGQGPSGSIQYLATVDGALTGSNTFTFESHQNTLFVSGSVVVSGTLSANTMDVIHTNKIEIDTYGNTNFGNDSTDGHAFTGSVAIISGSIRNHYHKLTTASYTIAAYDAIIGVSSSAYVSITLPGASAAGAGRLLTIKDEFNVTRTDSTRIAVSASGGDKIDHATTYSITGDSAALTLYSDGLSKWFIY
tara:strand:+ start:808 stop:1416 length:609 start_codon:yes stop_codon:yes gene_type:complete